MTFFGCKIVQFCIWCKTTPPSLFSDYIGLRWHLKRSAQELPATPGRICVLMQKFTPKMTFFWFKFGLFVFGTKQLHCTSAAIILGFEGIENVLHKLFRQRPVEFVLRCEYSRRCITSNARIYNPCCVGGNSKMNDPPRNF